MPGWNDKLLTNNQLDKPTNKKSNNILKKSWKAIKDIFKKNKEKDLEQNNLTFKRIKRKTKPCQIGVYVKEVSKERLELISQIEQKKKSDIIEMLLKDYWKKHYSNIELKNKE